MRSLPCSKSFMIEGVVATTLVSEAASKMVSIVMGSGWGIERARAVGFSKNDLVVMADHDYCAGNEAGLNGFIDDRIDKQQMLRNRGLSCWRCLGKRNGGTHQQQDNRKFHVERTRLAWLKVVRANAPDRRLSA